MVGFINQYEILFNKAKADLFAANVLYARFNEGNSELSDYGVEGRYAIMHDDLENIQNIFILLSNMVNEANTIVSGN